MKQIGTVVLLLFVATSVVFLAIKESRNDPSPVEPQAAANTPATPAPEAGHVIAVYYFHGDFRCKKCLAMEAYTREAVQKMLADQIRGGTVQWRVANFDQKENEHFVQDYALTASAVVLVEMEGSKARRWKNLDKIWDLVGDEASFKEYIVAETRGMLERGS
ncbi:MAG TPA: nitrophenyl compound nitroreductase subunit ArsF family protein [Phycisphaerae bacterium]|nr:nitrophenyl compound nitroreductase subunit ArsF family protein [Phycisphaerae bacterium]